MQDPFYQNRLYPFQNDVLKMVEAAGVEFYLTGGTALSRYYLKHRYSDDIDFFVNQNPEFKEQAQKIISLFKKEDWNCEVQTTADNFVRLMIERENISLKVDLVNDVAYHYGGFQEASFFKKIDDWRNILSNKICAISRLEPKDIADILFLAKKYQFDWENIIQESKEKDLWVEPLNISKIISEFPVHKLNQVKWIVPVEIELMEKELKILHNDIFYGKENTLTKDGVANAE